MKGSDLKAWRKKNGWTQADLMAELEINSRQTLSSWEKSDQLPHIARLAIIALDQIEACRKRSDLKTQFRPEEIAQMHMRTYRDAINIAAADERISYK